MDDIDFEINDYSEINNDLIAGLEDIGKNENKIIEKKEKNIIENKKKNPRPRVQNLMIPSIFESIPPIETKSLIESKPITSNQIIIPSIETRIINYLENFLLKLIKEFLIFLKEQFNEKENYNLIIFKFIKEIQEEIKKNIEINFDFTNFFENFESLFILFYPNFKEIFLENEKFKKNDFNIKNKKIRNFKITTNTIKNSIKLKFNELIEELNQQEIELNNFKFKKNQKFKINNNKILKLKELKLDLECKKIDIDSDLELIKKNKLIENEQSQLDLSNIDQNDLKYYLNDFIDLIKNEYFFNDLNKLDNIRNSNLKINNYLEKLNSLRYYYNLNSKLFNENLFSFNKITFVTNINNEKSNDFIEDLSSIENSPNKFNLKNQLNNYSKLNQSNLKNASNFIDSIRRNEKSKKK